MANRPNIDRLSIWECNELEIKRDTEHNCLEIICRGEDKYARLTIMIWSSTDGQAPVAKIDKTLVDTGSYNPLPSVDALIAAVDEVEPEGSEG